MKAVKWIEPHVVKTVECDVPELCEGEALVKVRAVGICGTDMAIIAGKHPRAQAPLVPGHEFAGQITELRPGKADADVEVGDKVTAYPLLVCGQCWSCRHGLPHACRSLRLIGIDRDGAMAEYVKVPLDLICKLPQTMRFEVGALVEPLAVGIHAVAMSEVTPADTAVVIGAGPIGLMVALALRCKGVKRFIVSEMNPFRLALAHKLGFETLDCTQRDVRREVQQMTAGEGADFVFEVSGGKEGARQMTDLARPRGTIMIVSCPKTPHEIDLRVVNFKELTLLGTRVYTRQDYAHAIAIAQELPLLELVTHRVPIDNAAAAFEVMKNPEHACKVLITME